MQTRQINRGCISEGETKSWQLILNTCLDRQPVKNSEEGWNMVSFTSFENESCGKFWTYCNFPRSLGLPGRNELQQSNLVRILSFTAARQRQKYLGHNIGSDKVWKLLVILWTYTDCEYHWWYCGRRQCVITTGDIVDLDWLWIPLVTFWT